VIGILGNRLAWVPRERTGVYGSVGYQRLPRVGQTCFDETSGCKTQEKLSKVKATISSTNTNAPE